MRNRASWAALILGLVAASTVSAHDSGFGHSRRTIFLAGAAPGELIVEYRITQNADEALIELIHADESGDGKVSVEEQDNHFQSVAIKLMSKLHFRTPGGTELRPTFVRFELQNSLTQTFRFQVTTEAREVVLEDSNFPHKPGQVRIVTGPGLKAEPVEATDLSHADRVSLRIVRDGS